ncbi:MAG TPA: ribonuclease H-like domain-containing protein, partial [Abditibacteriaceae bacterium]
MASWEEIANEVAPIDADIGGLATGARRGQTSAWQRPPAKTDRELKFLPPPQCAPGASFDTVMCGIEKQTSRHGTHYEIVQSARHYDAPFSELGTRLNTALQNSSIECLARAQARDLLVMDIETSGVNDATPLFLIGTLRFDEAEPQMEFFLARNSDEEAAVLAAYHQRTRGKRLVTFNGKSFDWPFI